MDSLGKLLVVAGLSLAGIGLLLWLLPPKQGGWLPGDLHIQKGNLHIVFPIATCLAVSALLTLAFWLFRKG